MPKEQPYGDGLVYTVHLKLPVTCTGGMPPYSLSRRASIVTEIVTGGPQSSTLKVMVPEDTGSLLESSFEVSTSTRKINIGE